LSLVTRLIGFGLCLVGTFLAAYALALHSSAAVIGNVVNTYVNVQGVSPDPAFLAGVQAQVSSYIQQNVTQIWTYYLAIGIAMAIFGSVLVVIGDRKPTNAEKQRPLQSQPLSVGRREQLQSPA
jgi:hypothetical protein